MPIDTSSSSSIEFNSERINTQKITTNLNSLSPIYTVNFREDRIITLMKYKKYINKKVIYYDRDGDCYVGYLAAIMPKDPEQPFAIYINYDGSPVEPERSADLFFSSRIEPLEDGE